MEWQEKSKCWKSPTKNKWLSSTSEANGMLWTCTLKLTMLSWMAHPLLFCAVLSCYFDATTQHNSFTVRCTGAGETINFQARPAGPGVLTRTERRRMAYPAYGVLIKINVFWQHLWDVLCFSFFFQMISSDGKAQLPLPRSSNSKDPQRCPGEIGVWGWRQWNDRGVIRAFKRNEPLCSASKGEKPLRWMRMKWNTRPCSANKIMYDSCMYMLPGRRSNFQLHLL